MEAILPLNRRSQNSDWLEGMKEQGLQDAQKVAKTEGRVDKIIQELEAVDQDWWVNYPLVREIIVTHSTLIKTDDPEACERLRGEIKRLKRQTVLAFIWPAMNACIRAGFVKPAE